MNIEDHKGKVKMEKKSGNLYTVKDVSRTHSLKIETILKSCKKKGEGSRR